MSDTTPMRIPATPIVAHAAPASPPGLSQSPDLFSLLGALRRRWVLATTAGVFFSAVVGAAAWFAIPKAKYTARSTLRIATTPPQVIFEPKEQRSDYRTYQRTQIALLKNRKVLADALRKPEIAELATVREQIDTDEWLEKQLKAEFPGDSEVLEVSLSGDRPEDLSKIVNAVVNSYMTLIVDQEREQRLKRLAQLKKLWEKYQSDLDLKRKSLRELATTVGSHDSRTLALTQQFKAEQLTLAQRELMRVQSEMLRSRASVAVLEAAPAPASRRGQANSAAAGTAVAADSPEVAALQQTVDRLAKKYHSVRRLARQATDPALVSIAREWDAANRQLQAARARDGGAAPVNPGDPEPEPAVNPELVKAREQVKLWETYQTALAKDIERLREESKNITEGSMDVQTEQDEISIANNVARLVGSEVQAVEVELSAPERILILSEAKVPKVKDEMRQVKASGAAAAASLALSLLGVSMLEFRARRVQSPDEVVNGLGMKLVGALPAPPAGNRRGNPRGAARHRVWSSALVESVDAARTVLLHASRSEAIRTIMVASAVKGEGKTSLACHLATSLARAGRKTLLLDCDLRSPSSHRLIGRSLGPGLCEYLRKEAGVNEIIQGTPAPGLDLIPAGRCDAYALQLLSHDDLRALFEELRFRYDYVILDSAPILPVTDSLLVSQHVDAVLFSMLRGLSCMPKVHAAWERLSVLGVRVLGAVLNGVPAPINESTYYSPREGADAAPDAA